MSYAHRLTSRLRYWSRLALICAAVVYLLLALRYWLMRALDTAGGIAANPPPAGIVGLPPQRSVLASIWQQTFYDLPELIVYAAFIVLAGRLSRGLVPLPSAVSAPGATSPQQRHVVAARAWLVLIARAVVVAAFFQYLPTLVAEVFYAGRYLLDPSGFGGVPARRYYFQLFFGLDRPFGPLVLAVGLWFVAPLLARFAAPAPRAACLRCGYAKGEAPTCSECGLNDGDSALG